MKIELMCFSTVARCRYSVSAMASLVLALRHQPEHLTLAFGQPVDRRRTGTGLAGHQRVDHLGIDHRAAGDDLVHRPGDGAVVVADALLEQIAEPGRAVLEQLEGVAVVGVLRQHQHPDPRMPAADLVGRLDALHLMRRRHADVGDHGVGEQLVDPGEELVGPVDGGDHLDLAVQLEHRPHPLAVHLVVLGDHDPQRHDATVGVNGNSAITVVPTAPSDRTLTLPPSAAARSAMLVRPRPVARARRQPAPVVADGQDETLRLQRQRDGHLGRLGVLDDVGERLGRHEVGSALDAALETPVGQRLVDVQRDLQREALGPGVDRRHDALVVEDRRMDALGDRTHVTERPAHVVLGAGDGGHGGVGRDGDLIDRQAQLAGQRRQLLLHAVVDVALDAPSLLVLSLDDARTRRRDLGRLVFDLVETGRQLVGLLDGVQPQRRLATSAPSSCRSRALNGPPRLRPHSSTPRRSSPCISANVAAAG